VIIFSLFGSLPFGRLECVHGNSATPFLLAWSADRRATVVRRFSVCSPGITVGRDIRAPYFVVRHGLGCRTDETDYWEACHRIRSIDASPPYTVNKRFSSVYAR
jgi:hypothetical protein